MDFSPLKEPCNPHAPITALTLPQPTASPAYPGPNWGTYQEGNRVKHPLALA